MKIWLCRFFCSSFNERREIDWEMTFIDLRRANSSINRSLQERYKTLEDIDDLLEATSSRHALVAEDDHSLSFPSPPPLGAAVQIELTTNKFLFYWMFARRDENWKEEETRWSKIDGRVSFVVVTPILVHETTRETQREREKKGKLMQCK